LNQIVLQIWAAVYTQRQIRVKKIKYGIGAAAAANLRRN